MLAFLVVLLSISGTAAVWPHPVSISYGKNMLTLDPVSFKFQANIQSTVLNEAFTRYKSLIFWKSESESAGKNLVDSLQRINVEVNSSSEVLNLGTDESYNLSVVSPMATLTAKTVFGALHGLETFSQLIQWHPYQKSYFIGDTPIIITDSPRFPHRGLMIDTSRHFLPVSTILRTIDAMSYNKLNVLHWHVVDAESFPMISVAAPKLSQGAWAPDLTYSPQDVKYAYNRGIRVIPEFDTPGHSHSWGIGYPDIVATCPPYAQNVDNIPLDPTNPETTTIVTNFMTEMAQLFPDQYFHIGGDEVVYGCWKDDKKIVNWMSAHGISSYDQLMQLYENQLWQTLGKANKTLIAWQEIFNAYGLSKFPPGLVIEVWKDQTTLLNVAKSSLHGLLAYGWYLNQLSKTWQDFYENEPFSSSEWNSNLEKFILGGEACAWGEQINAENFDPVVWPRAAATAERLWSPKTVTDANEALVRLIGQTCILNRRGIRASPLKPGYCPNQ